MTDYATAATKRCLTGQVIAPRVEGGPERLELPRARPVRALLGGALVLAATLGACALLEVVRRVYEWRLP